MLSDLVERLSSRDVAEAEDSRAEFAGLSCTRIADIQPRQVATVAGHISSITRSVAGQPPRLTITVTDGTSHIRAMFMGRRRVAGLETGAAVLVHARFSQGRGALLALNPEYTLVETAKG